MCVCVAIDVYNWNEHPIVVISQVSDFGISRCEQFIQEICGCCDRNPFASMNRRLNEDCWISLRKMKDVSSNGINLDNRTTNFSEVFFKIFLTVLCDTLTARSGRFS